MANLNTAIEWTDATWNPVTGCTKVSAGCRFCYAETVANRFWKDRQFTDVRCHPERLDRPLRWRKPKRIFVNSMSDLFHEDVPFEFIDKVFAVMALCPQHTFQVLTKRAERMREYLHKDMQRYSPLRNVHLGVSCENQDQADRRIPELLATPAAVRFVSAEPLLGSVTLHPDWTDRWYCADCGTPRLRKWCSFCAIEARPKAAIDWVIVGGESGSGARPCNVEWIRSIIAQCKTAGVPCFVKQMGSNVHERNDRIADVWYYADGSDMDTEAIDHDSYRMQGMPVRLKLHSRKGGDPSEWPEDLRVREYPAVREESR